MSIFGVVGFSALVLVVLGWLVVSFSEPSPRRTRVEWLSACALYVALIALFGNLVRRALEADNLLTLGAFGFLLALFSVGFVLALAQLWRSGASAGQGDSSATH